MGKKKKINKKVEDVVAIQHLLLYNVVTNNRRANMPTKEMQKQKRADIKRLKYLLNKEGCCPLDKGELWELQELLDRYGYPQY